MRAFSILISIVALISLASAAYAQTSYQIYLRIDDGNGPLPGPVATLPGVTGSNFFPVGCTEHQFEAVGMAAPSHSPYLVTKPFDPATSPLLRQQVHQNASYTVELFFMADNGGVLSAYFGVRLENAVLQKITTAADGNDLQETLSLVYDRIIWRDLINGTSRGWDLTLNQAI